MNIADLKIKILFVCMGNICRSPLAEGVFQAMLETQNLSQKFIIDSAGTSNYHVGDLADQRAVSVAKQRGVNLTHRARQFVANDFEEFDYILVMDHLNYDAVLNLGFLPHHPEKVFLFRSFDIDAQGEDNVPDPYCGGEEDFGEVIDIVSRASMGFIQFLHQEKLLA